MKTQAQVQKIFDVLVAELRLAPEHNLLYISKDYITLNDSPPLLSPLDGYLKSVQRKLTDGDFNEEFFKSVYEKAFYTCPIPKNRNYVAITCTRRLESRPISSLPDLWIDLDKVAAQLNTHLQINPSYCLKVTNNRTKSYGTMGLTYRITTSVNSVYRSRSFTQELLIVCAAITCVSSYTALIIAALAVFSLISISTVGIAALAGGALLGAAATYGFFTVDPSTTTRTTPVATTGEEPMPANIEKLFEERFGSEKIDASLDDQTYTDRSSTFAMA